MAAPNDMCGQTTYRMNPVDKETKDEEEGGIMMNGEIYSRSYSMEEHMDKNKVRSEELLRVSIQFNK